MRAFLFQISTVAIIYMLHLHTSPVRTFVDDTGWCSPSTLRNLHSKGHCAPTIAKLFTEEDIIMSWKGVHTFFVQVQQTGDTTRCPGSGWPSKRTDEVKEVIKMAMRADNETTVKELQKKLTNAGHSLSLSSTLHCRMDLGWTVRGSAYVPRSQQSEANIYTRWRQAF